MSDDAHSASVNNPNFAMHKNHYDKVIATQRMGDLVYSETLYPHTGGAFFVKAGQAIRVEQTEDFAQILDGFIISPDLTEYLNYGRSDSKIWRENDGSWFVNALTEVNYGCQKRFGGWSILRHRGIYRVRDVPMGRQFLRWVV